MATVEETTAPVPSFGQMLWAAIQQFRKDSPGIYNYEATFSDGSKVRLRLKKGKGDG